MTKTDKLNELFDEWKQIEPYRGKFICDGIIDEDLYSNSDLKVLYLAKEPNKPDQTPGDFREYWKQQLKDPFAYRLSEWSYGILNKFPEYDTISNSKDVKDETFLRSTAFMNLKKIGGSGIADYNNLVYCINRDRNFIFKQIDIIDPDFIVAGIRGKLRSCLFPDISWQPSGYGVEVGRYKNSKVIDFYHPSSRSAPSALYCLLQNVMQSKPFLEI